MLTLPDNYAFMTKGQKDEYFASKGSGGTPAPTIDSINQTSNLINYNSAVKQNAGQAPVGGFTKLGQLSPIGSVSSEAGANQVDTLRNSQTQMTGDPTAAKATADAAAKAKADAQAKTDATNAETAKNNALFGTNGTNGTTTPTKTPDQIKAETDLETAKSTVTDLTSKLTNLDVSQDPALQRMLTGITGQWDARIREMQRVNDSRNASITTTGIRLGDRYTGGSGGMFGGIIAEEERQGVERVAGLEAQKQAALSAAENAFRTQKWTEYSKLVGLAQDKLNEQQEELQKLNAATQKQNELLEKQKKEDAENKIVTDAISQGFTDSKELANYLKTQGVSLDATNIEKILKVANPAEALSGLSADFKTYKFLLDSKDPSVKGMSYIDYQNAVYNATHAKPKGVGSGSDGVVNTETNTTPQDDISGVQLPPYEEWVRPYLQTPEGHALAVKFAGDNIELAKAAKEKYASLTAQPVKPVNLGKLTPTETKVITRAGLANANSNVKATLLSYESAFQNELIRDAASQGVDLSSITPEGLKKLHDQWERDSSKTTKKSSSTSQRPQ